MDLQQCRKEIDEIDSQLVGLFSKRMKVAHSVAEYKIENNMAVFDAERERKLLSKVESEAGEEFGDYTRRLYNSILDLSRAYQNKYLMPKTLLHEEIQDALNKTDKLFPESSVVACQGIEGAYSANACQKIFKKPSIMFCETFDAVFQSVEKGLCRYGIVPLENSTAGSVNKTYELMSEYKFHIVRSAKMQIQHNLLGIQNANLKTIKEIYSHPQAIGQCSDFLSELGKDVKVVPCENTAMAAKKVADLNRKDVAAISSSLCASQYSLDIIKPFIQNTSNNYTRFICFSKDLEIYPGADRTSLLIRTPHRPGALYTVMAHFYSLGINILKLESRPVPKSDFEFMFYFDIDVSVYSDEFLKIIDLLQYSLGSQCVKYLGSYREV